MLGKMRHVGALDTRARGVLRAPNVVEDVAASAVPPWLLASPASIVSPEHNVPHMPSPHPGARVAIQKTQNSMVATIALGVVT